MAGDWIKMRGNLWDDPRIGSIVDATDTSEAAVIGGLYWLWATADQHTEDGVMPGLTLRQIDRKTSIPGLGEALVNVGWLADHPEGIRIIKFEEHNGASAKKRCQTAKRVANHKAGNAEVTQEEDSGNAESVTTALPREEKRREEKIKPIKSKAESATASRLPADWQPNAEEIAFCQAERQDLDAQAVASRFRDYWIAQPGAKGRKTDWTATWRNWVRNERAVPQARGSPQIYESERDRSRREAAEALTGRKVSGHSNEFIDIN